MSGLRALIQRTRIQVMDKMSFANKDNQIIIVFIVFRPSIRGRFLTVILGDFCSDTQQENPHTSLYRRTSACLQHAYMHHPKFFTISLPITRLSIHVRTSSNWLVEDGMTDTICDQIKETRLQVPLCQRILRCCFVIYWRLHILKAQT